MISGYIGMTEFSLLSDLLSIVAGDKGYQTTFTLSAALCILNAAHAP